MSTTTTHTRADHDPLVRMANQIGAFFEAMPERPEALENAARHIRSFWAPPMRRALLEQVDGPQADALSGFMVEAVRTHRHLFG